MALSLDTGNRVAQPNNNLAPQLGVAWDPKSDGKTVIRAGIGIYYDNTVFNDILFDRLLKLPTGAFFVDSVPCFTGSSIPVVFGGTGAQSRPTSRVAMPLVAARWGRRSRRLRLSVLARGLTTAACIGQFQSA